MDTAATPWIDAGKAPGAGRTRTRVLAPALVLAAIAGALLSVNPAAAGILAALVLAPALIWAEPTVALVLFSLLLGFNIDVIGDPVHVSLPQVAALGFAGSVYVRTRGGLYEWRRLGSLWTNAAFLLFAATLLALPGAVAKGAAVAGAVRLFAVAAVIAAAVTWFRARAEAIDQAIVAMAIGAVASTLPAVVQVALQVGPTGYVEHGLMRAYSTYGQPNSYGTYLTGILPLVVLRAPRSRRYGAAAGAIAIALALTGSRGGWVAAVSSFTVMYFASAKGIRRSVLIGLGGLVVLLAAWALLPTEFVAGRFSLNDWSTQQRLLILLSTLDGIARRPLTGYGPGSFGIMLHSIARYGVLDDVQMPHNMLLHLWFEYGLLALLVFAGGMVALFRSAIPAFRRCRDARLLGAIGGLAGMLVASMFGSLLIRGISETFGLLIALTAALVLDSKSREAL